MERPWPPGAFAVPAPAPEATPIVRQVYDRCPRTYLREMYKAKQETVKSLQKVKIYEPIEVIYGFPETAAPDEDPVESKK